MSSEDRRVDCRLHHELEDRIPPGALDQGCSACRTYQIYRTFVMFLLILTFSITGPFSLSMTMFYNFQLLNVRLTKPDEEQSYLKLLLLNISNKPTHNALCSKSNGSYDIKDFGTLPLIFSTSKYFRQKFQPCPSFFSHRKG